ncbi:hypothetical protein CDAR_260461 [Caerostris darwini]|uniref:Uncharacterized protein n=1 Tax=Caerostris darwini TaxID=1538125 RepID=A0AAV4NSS5_9ARAC|nr:hypothetical protein CDAR_260461 [Caerostris darwini]
MFPQLGETQHSTIPTVVWIFLVVGIIFILGSCLATLWRGLTWKKSTRTDHPLDRPSRLPTIYSPQPPPAPSFANLQVVERHIYPDNFILVPQSQCTGFGIHDPPPKYSDVVHQESSDGHNGRFNCPAIIEVERTTSSPPECHRPESSSPECSPPPYSSPEISPPAYSPPESSLHV